MPNPGTIWLTTPRTTPAWAALLHLLQDHQWHPLDEAKQTMRQTANLTDTTIHRQLKAASQRKWINTHKGHIRIRNKHLIEAALTHTEEPQ